ncbi:MAG TPA: hypothetical protein VIS07_04920 [Candidatus Binatia bacterium]
MGALALLAVLATACSSVQTRSIHFVGRPEFPPTDPATVEILSRPPERPHWVLGQIIAEPQGNPGDAAIEEKLREDAAAMGGNAVVIVHDGLRRVGAVWQGGPWWGGGTIHPVMGQVISAIVVRFKPEGEP